MDELILQKPQLKTRSIDHNYIACPYCGSEFMTYELSKSSEYAWMFSRYAEENRKQCDCGVWQKKINDIDEYVWSYRERNKQEEKEFKRLQKKK